MVQHRRSAWFIARQVSAYRPQRVNQLLDVQPDRVHRRRIAAAQLGTSGQSRGFSLRASAVVRFPPGSTPRQSASMGLSVSLTRPAPYPSRSEPFANLVPTGESSGHHNPEQITPLTLQIANLKRSGLVRRQQVSIANPTGTAREALYELRSLPL